jgi:hypothetical protein
MMAGYALQHHHTIPRGLTYMQPPRGQLLSPPTPTTGGRAPWVMGLTTNSGDRATTPVYVVMWLCLCGCTAAIIM